MPLKNLLRASFMVTLNGHKQGHVHIGNARIQRGYVYRESGTPWKTTSSIEKKQLGPIALEKVGAPGIFDPPPLLRLWKNYSFFEINIGPPL